MKLEIDEPDSDLVRAYFNREQLFESGIPAATGASVTNAELTPEEKDEISHRGRALRALAPVIAERVAR